MLDEQSKRFFWCCCAVAVVGCGDTVVLVPGTGWATHSNIISSVRPRTRNGPFRGMGRQNLDSAEWVFWILNLQIGDLKTQTKEF